MSDTRIRTMPRWPSPENDVQRRLNWLLAANKLEESNRRRFRNPDDEEQMLLMRRPISIEPAYALLGMLLGTLPSAVLLARLFYDELRHPYLQWDWLCLLLAMNLGCCLMGRWMGYKVGGKFSEIQSRSWSRLIFASLYLGLLWGIITGGAGGAVFFGVGARVGALYAAPVGLLAFPLFTVFHRLLSHGGMIDARHLWPLACGISALIAAMVL